MKNNILDDMHIEFLDLCAIVSDQLKQDDYYTLVWHDEIEEEWLDGICATVAMELGDKFMNKQRTKTYTINVPEVVAIPREIFGVYLFKVER